LSLKLNIKKRVKKQNERSSFCFFFITAQANMQKVNFILLALCNKKPREPLPVEIFNLLGLTILTKFYGYYFLPVRP